jgi:hypothetical protein
MARHARGRNVTADKEIGKPRTAMTVVVNGERVGRMACFAPVVHLPEMDILVARAALDADAFQAHRDTGSRGKHACRGLMAERARDIRMLARQREDRSCMREPDDAELCRPHAVARLALAPDLAEVNVFVTCHTACRRAGEPDVEDGRTGQLGNGRLTVDDVALTARYQSVLPVEEFRKIAMPVCRDRKARCGMTRFACRPELILVHIIMTTDARDA